MEGILGKKIEQNENIVSFESAFRTKFDWSISENLVFIFCNLFLKLEVGEDEIPCFTDL
jgi:hypothetical protein